MLAGATGFYPKESISGISRKVMKSHKMVGRSFVARAALI
jgi:hypothetical protein